MVDGKNNTKKIAFVVVALVIVFLLYWFVIRKKLKAAGYMLPAEYAQARSIYERNMLNYIKAGGDGWYAALKAAYKAKGLGDIPSDEFILENVRYTVPDNNKPITIAGDNGVVIYKGATNALYGY